MKPLITVVCGTYNRLNTLQRMIRSVRYTVPRDVPIDFVIADNASDDGTWDWLQSQDDITAIQMGAPVGAITAFTEAAKLATGQYVLIATDDIHFPPLGIITALGHLDSTPDCGAVSFMHNKNRDYFAGAFVHVTYPNGQVMTRPYTQISLVRKWIGDKVGWWGGDDPIMGKGFTYGGDNYLGAGIWELGYTVDNVKGAINIEDVLQDAPRALNEAAHRRDANLYWECYPTIQYPGKPSNLPDNEQLRILLLLHYNPTHPHHKEQKQWLRKGFSEYGVVYDYDYAGRYKAGVNINDELGRVCDGFRPHIILSQVHRPSHGFTSDTAQTLRLHSPDSMMVNWNGDVYLTNVQDPRTKDLLSHYNMLLFSNAYLADYMADLGFCAGYLPEGFEPFKDIELNMPSYDVLFTGSGYSEWRLNLIKFVQDLPYQTAFYGNAKDIQSKGNTMWNWKQTRGLYHNAKIVISDQQFRGARGYVSKRLWEVMASGGGVVFQQYSHDLDKLTGLETGKHYVVWRNLTDLRNRIDEYLNQPDKLKAIAQSAYDYVWQYHNPQKRVQTIFDYISKL